MVLGIIAVIIFLSIFILAHEFGHFLTAKKFGLLVEEFGFGLPPRIFGKKIGETIYSINALPFGGFVKIYGEDAAPEAPKAISPEKEEISVLKMQKISVSDEVIAASEETIIEEAIIPARDRSFRSLVITKRAIIIVAGVFTNFLIGWLALSLVLAIGIPEGILITGVSENSPAAAAGLVAGDKVINFSKADDFINYIDGHRGENIVLQIERGGKQMEIKATPRINPPVGEGALGIALNEVGLERENPLLSLWQGFKASIGILGMVFMTIFKMLESIFVGQASFEAVAGPVGIVKLSAEASSFGFIFLLQFLALISLNLVVINILPFPALDGGRLLFLLIEKIKGSPLPAKFERYANALGMAFLLLLMLLVTIRDVSRLL